MSGIYTRDVLIIARIIDHCSYNFDSLHGNIGHRKMRDACSDNHQINNVRAVCASWSKQVLGYNAYGFDKFLMVFYAFLKLDLNWI